MSLLQTRATTTRREPGRGTCSLLQPGWLVVEALLLIAALALVVIVNAHPAPLPGDVAGSLGLQHLVRPYKLVVWLLEGVSTINWPVPAAITLGLIAVVLALLRWWLGVAVLLPSIGLADGANYLTAEAVRRPRPTDHGLHITSMIKNFYSFPSGHVEHMLVVYGFLLYLSFRVPRAAPWLWVVRLIMIAQLVLIMPSRLWEGEHWPSDVLEGLLYGAFWLIIAIQVYRWAWQRWPRWRGGDHQPACEREADYRTEAGAKGRALPHAAAG